MRWTLHNSAVGVACIAALLAASTGCQALLAPRVPLPVMPPEPSPESDAPRELAKVSLPEYVIEPPDILTIEAVKIVPKSPHLIETYDVLNVVVRGTLLDQPISGPVQVGPDGRIDLGPAYGMVKVIGLTVDEAKTQILTHLQQSLEAPAVSVALVSSAGAQQITGVHSVHPDGTVNLGSYGTVYVSGLTIPQAREAIEEQLTKFLESPEVAVDVFSYNSKVYYLITASSGLGDDVRRVPITGNETVLDAISEIGGISQISSKKIWVARPAPNGVGCEQILPVDWDEITRSASTATNFQLMPGDRLFVAEDGMLALDTFIGKVTRPFERVFGFTILGAQLVNRLRTLSANRNFF
jgi:polysaccharide export outer membrane protein